MNPQDASNHNLQGLTPASANRRQSERITLRTKVQCVTETHLIETRSINISAHGACLSDIPGVKLAEEVKLYIALPKSFSSGKRLFMLRGRISWIEETCVGVYFVDQDAKLFEELRVLLWEHGATFREQEEKLPGIRYLPSTN